jgi:replicative DNA helicase Mcm
VDDAGGYRSTEIGNLLAVRGQVAKRTQVKPRPVTLAYECQRCGTVTHVQQAGGEVQEPHECHGCERQGPFKTDEERSEWEDHQLVRIQEPPEETVSGEGAHVDVHLNGDMVANAESGDRVTVTGIMSLEEPSGDAVAYDPYIDGTNLRVEQTDYEDIDVEKYESEIKTIAGGEHGDPFELITDSIAPKVRGRDTIKGAIALQLFGAPRLEYPDGSFDRGDSHVLLLGDPGTAKSSLLQAVENIAPRAVFASGKGASAAGMTAAAVPDDFGDQKWGLEAGAMVLANKGVACVDEIDKVDENAVDSLHEALENQRVNVNKAGFNTTLPTRTALLAAGNPKYGRFDQHESIAEQIDLDPALISRFDLMFMIDDAPDEERDREIVSGILESKRTAAKYTDDSTSVDEAELEAIQPAIDTETLRAYIAYAKKHVTPHLSPTVETELEDWFVDVRLANGEGTDVAIPVTHRKLEGIVRLAMASARVRLSNRVEEADLERAKALVLRSMRDVGMDPETGEFDADIVETGRAKSQKDRIKLVRDLIAKIAAEHDRGAPRDVVVERAIEEGCGESEAAFTIEKLKDKGLVWEQESGRLRVT